MNLIAKARRDTPLYTIPGNYDSGNKVITQGTEFRVIGSKKVGLDTYYRLSGIGSGYVRVEDTIIMRDMDYYIEQRQNKRALKTTKTMEGKIGLSSIIGSMQNDLTYNWNEQNGMFKFDLQQFGFMPAVTSTADTAKNVYVGSNTGNINTGYESQEITSALGGLGVTTNSTISSALSGISVASLSNGTFLGQLANNLLNMLGSWLSARLNFVVGFDISAALSSLFNLFGTKWSSSINKNLSSFFGSSIPSVFGNGHTQGYHTSDEYSVASKSGWGVKFIQVYAGQGDLFEFKYAPVTQAMIDFFKYKGCNGRMITKRWSGLTWTQDATYATPTLEAKKDQTEVSVWQELSRADYSQFADSLKVIREEFNINISRNAIFTKFNRFRVPTPDNELHGTRGYIFFTRPDLNLTDAPGVLTSYAEGLGDNVSTRSEVHGYGRAIPLMINMMKSHPVLTNYLMGASAGVDHQFFPLLGHACEGLDVADEVLETTEAGETFTGWKYIYGTSLIKSKTAGTANVNFRDDDMLSVFKILKLWGEYINAVWRGEMRPKKIYSSRHIIDYAISIYYFLCKATSNNEILFWTKYTGAFPTSIPSSTFSDQLGNNIKRPNYSVPFAFARKDDMDVMNIIEFNNLSSRGSYSYMPIYNEKTHHVNRSFVGAPFVDTGDGGRLFRLKFRDGGTDNLTN